MRSPSIDLFKIYEEADAAKRSCSSAIDIGAAAARHRAFHFSIAASALVRLRPAWLWHLRPARDIDIAHPHIHYRLGALCESIICWRRDRRLGRDQLSMPGAA